MKSFFQQLEEYRVHYLLVSGQAAVLHGAALFSEDVDLWVEPEGANLERLLQALRATQSRYYKLTPPVTEEFAKTGHGFHFLIPDKKGDGEFYLDVMGCPPRVSDFQSCMDRANRMSTEWGSLPVLGRRDLVDIKKTQRLRDYPVISRLAMQEIPHDNERIPASILDWVWSHLFELEDAERFMTLTRNRQVNWFPKEDGDASWIEAYKSQSNRTDEDVALENRMLSNMAEYRRADRMYWKKIIEDLKILRMKNILEPEGHLV